MDLQEDDGVRARSFRYEDYKNRRAFLRSYPLNWEGDEESEEEEEEEEEGMLKLKSSKVGKRRIFLSVLEWGGGKVLLLRKMKHKVASLYLVACCPFGFKPTSTLLSL